MAAVIAATSSSLGLPSDALFSVADCENCMAILDIADIPKTRIVRNENTVPMPTSMSVIP